jgi:hypothetical protein
MSESPCSRAFWPLARLSEFLSSYGVFGTRGSGLPSSHAWSARRHLRAENTRPLASPEHSRGSRSRWPIVIWSSKTLTVVLGVSLALSAASCASPYPSPTAVIASFDTSSAATPTACKPLTGKLDARIGAALPVTAACSEDKNKSSLSYFWSLVDAPAGSVAAFHNEDAITPTFVPDVAGSFRLKLVVSNGVVTSDPAFAEVVVGVCGGRAPRVTPSASTKAPHAGELVMLSVDTVDDDTADGCAAHAAVFGYAWALVQIPAESRASLNAASVRSPSFTADVPGHYVARVFATDPTGRTSDAGEIAVDASACGSNAPVIEAITPSVAAPATGQTVTLAASVSDADTASTCQAHAATFSYDWSFTDLPPGSLSELNDATVAAPSFVPDVAGVYGFAVSVTDPTGRHTTSTSSLSASGPTVRPADCGHSPPVAGAQLVMPGTPSACGDTPLLVDLAGNNQLMLDAAPSSDPDNAACGASQTLTYAWTLLATPLNGGFSHLESRDGRSTILRVWSDGAYQVRLVVTDSTGLASPATVCSLYVQNYK